MCPGVRVCVVRWPCRITVIASFCPTRCTGTPSTCGSRRSTRKAQRRKTPSYCPRTHPHTLLDTCLHVPVCVCVVCRVQGWDRLGLADTHDVPQSIHPRPPPIPRYVCAWPHHTQPPPSIHVSAALSPPVCVCRSCVASQSRLAQVQRGALQAERGVGLHRGAMAHRIRMLTTRPWSPVPRHAARGGTTPAHQDTKVSERHPSHPPTSTTPSSPPFLRLSAAGR